MVGKFFSLAVMLAIFAMVGGTAAAVTVNCGAGQTISAALAKLKPSKGYQTVNVSGACKENVYLPPGLLLSIVGSAGASLVPADTGPPTIEVDGSKIVVSQMAITAGTFAAFYLHDLAHARITATTISGPGTGIQVSNNAGLLLQNSTISVTGYAAINLYNNGTVEVDGLAPIGAFSGTSLTGAGDAISCGSGVVVLNANGGSIALNNNGNNGLDSQGCNIAAYVSGSQVVSISNNKGSGINAGQASSITLSGVAITGNGAFGINAEVNAAIQLAGSTVITGNTLPAIQMDQNAVLNIQNYAGGANTISAQSSKTVLFSCYQGGKIYVNQISGYITPPPNANNIGCLTVGGP